jgi:phage terminase large subunit-like protein
VTRDQARILFDTAREMVRRSPEFRRKYRVETNQNAIAQMHTASKFSPISSDAKGLDGLNVQIAVCDEIGSHRTSEVYNALLTATGKRKHPMLISISTATGNSSGIGKRLWDYGVKVLEGVQDDPRMFVLLYGVDAEDDPWDEATWIKANPGWGITVQPDAVRAIMRQARNNPAQEAAAKTQHLNVWVGADEALFSMRAWRESADTSLSMDQFEGRSAYVGVDLASKTDLGAVSLVFPDRDDHGRMSYSLFSICFTNEAAVIEARNPSYPGWSADGYLYVTSGNETDFAVIEDYIRDLCRRFDVRQVGYDPWQSTHMAQRLMAGGIPVIEYRAVTSNFSEPTKELEAAMRAKRLWHDGNPVLKWCIGNVVGHYDARGSVYPRKQRPEQKIDAAISTIMAVGLAMRDEDAGPSVYETRGPMFV